MAEVKVEEEPWMEPVETKHSPVPHIKEESICTGPRVVAVRSLVVDKKLKKKPNFTTTEVNVLVEELQARKMVLFGTHGMGITNKRKTAEWLKVTSSVNAVSAVGRTVSELKKKWSDTKIEVKKKLALHRKSLEETGGELPCTSLTDFDQKVAGIIAEDGVGSIVEAEEGDTDTVLIQTVDSENSDPGEGTSAVAPAPTPTPTPAPAPVPVPVPSIPLNPSQGTAPRVTRHSSTPVVHSARVLTDTVVDLQRRTVEGISNVCEELRQIKEAFQELNKLLREHLQK